MKVIYRDITAITVCCNTRDLMRKMYENFRKYHSLMKMIVIDCSDKGNVCQKYLDQICSEQTTVYRFNKNVGHGRGLNFGIARATTPYVVIMDTDTLILKSPLREMMNLMDKETYGVGWVTEIGRDGYDFGTFKTQTEAIKYLHPYFALINVEQFRRYVPFCHHGAPWYKTAVQMHDRKESWRLKNFLTGHTSGHGANWTGTPSEWVQHDFGGTRIALRRMGRKEVEGKWEF